MHLELGVWNLISRLWSLESQAPKYVECGVWSLEFGL